MSNEDIKQELTATLCEMDWNDEKYISGRLSREAIIQCINMVEKQISKKPVLLAMNGFDPEVAAELCCPSCKEPIHSDFIKPFMPKYCRECGQRLDWSKE